MVSTHLCRDLRVWLAGAKAAGATAAGATAGATAEEQEEAAEAEDEEAEAGSAELSLHRSSSTWASTSRDAACSHQ